MILMLLLFGCFSKMFSGFKSQWMTCRQHHAWNTWAVRVCAACRGATFSCLRYRKLTSICNAKRRMSDRVSPWNLLFLINSYLIKGREHTAGDGIEAEAARTS